MRPDSAPGLEPYRNQDWDASSFKSEPYNPNAPSAHITAPSSRRVATNGFISKIPLVAIVLQMIAVSVSIATVGLLANAIAIYRSSKDWKIVMGSGVILPGWREPGDSFMVPIYSLLGSATAGAILGAIVLGSTIFIVSHHLSIKPLTRLITGHSTSNTSTASSTAIRSSSQAPSSLSWYSTLRLYPSSESKRIALACLAGVAPTVSWRLSKPATLSA